MKRLAGLLIGGLILCFGLTGCGLYQSSWNPFGGEEKTKTQKKSKEGPLVMPGEVEKKRDERTRTSRARSGSPSGRTSNQPRTYERTPRNQPQIGQRRSRRQVVGPEIEGPEKARRLAQQAHQAYRNGRVQKAIKMYKRASQLDPTDSTYFINLGSLYFNQEEYEKAIRFYQGALSIDSENAQAYYYLGATYRRTGRTSKAKSYLEKSLALDPGNQKAKNLLDQMR